MRVNWLTLLVVFLGFALAGLALYQDWPTSAVFIVVAIVWFLVRKNDDLP